MKETMIINKVVQLKAISHPLRMQILETMSFKPMTTKQVAAVLEKQPTRLYHHVNILEKAGLITLLRTEKKRGTTEKYYKTAAREFTVNRGLLHSRQGLFSSMSDMKGMITTQLARTIQEMQQSIELQGKGRVPGGQRVVLSSSRIHTTPARIKILNAEISRILKKYEAAPSRKGTNEYKFTLVLYPVTRDIKEKKIRDNQTRRKK